MSIKSKKEKHPNNPQETDQENINRGHAISGDWFSNTIRKDLPTIIKGRDATPFPKNTEDKKK